MSFKYFNYIISENGEVQNQKTEKFLTVKEKSTGKFVTLSIEGKSKTVNVTKLIEEYKQSQTSKDKCRSKKSKKYIIRVTELNGTVREFSTFKSANDFYGLRKDYLNYCIAEKFSYMLTKSDLNLKSVEKVLK